MKSKKNILVILIATLFIAGATHCYAQSAPAPIPSSDASLVKQVGKSGAFYFKKADVIKGSAFFYALGTVKDIDKEQDVITLTFSFQVSGENLEAPDTVSLSITSKSLISKYGMNHKLRLFGDAKLIMYAETEVTRPRQDGNSYATERFLVNAIKLKELEQLAKASKIVVQFGDTKILLSDEQRKYIRDFYQLATN